MNSYTNGNAPRSRPTGISVVAVWLILSGSNGILALVTFILLSFWTDVGKIFTRDQTHLPFWFFPVLSLMAIAYIIIGFGLWKLKNWARKILVVLSSLYAMCGIVFSIFSYSPVPAGLRVFALSVFLTMTALLVLLARYLVSPRVRMAFGVGRGSE